MPFIGLLLTTLMAAPQAFYLQEIGETCNWMLRNAEKKQVKTFHQTKACPSQILLDSKEKRTLYIQEKKLYSHSWDHAPATAKLIAELPSLPHNEFDGELILTEPERKMRIVYLQELKEGEVQIKEDKRYYLYKGKWIEGREPAVGVPAFAIVQDLEKDGKWVEKQMVQTDTGACDTVGLDMLDRSQRKLASGIEVMPKAGGTMPFVQMGWQPISKFGLEAPDLEKIKKQFPKFDTDESEIVAFSWGEKKLLFFLKTHVDTFAYPEAPIFIGSKKGDAINFFAEKPEKPGRKTFSFHRASPFLALEETETFPRHNVTILKEGETEPWDRVEWVRHNSFSWVDESFFKIKD